MVDFLTKWNLVKLEDLQADSWFKVILKCQEISLAQEWKEVIAERRFLVIKRRMIMEMERIIKQI